MAGRRTKLTPQVQQTIMTAVAAGAPFETACIYAGVSASVGHVWRRSGERAAERSAYTSPYFLFLQALRQARSQDEVRRIARINRAGEGGAVTHRKTIAYEDGRTIIEEHVAPPDWRADAWHLERTRPQTWGPQARLSIDVTVRQLAAKVAEELGVEVEAVLVEAQALLMEADRGESSH